MFRTLLGRYNRLLDVHPYKTQCITAATLWCTGDLLSQAIEHHGRTSDSGSSHSVVPTAHCEPLATAPALLGGGGVALSPMHIGEIDPTSRRESDLAPARSFRVDWHRLGVMTGFGLCLAGPLYTWWYSTLDRTVLHLFALLRAARPASSTTVTVAAASSAAMASAHGAVTMSVATTKLVGDLFVFEPPYLSLFFVATNIFSGHSASDTARRYQRDFWPTYKVDLAVWAPIQLVNFKVVPVPLQPVFVNAVNVFWNAYLSYVKHK
ncbi:hypothetical protein GGF31_005932 [Allomyces arbusculus]|nr:hypothetical protein GGF31_005932 [Allomyces arbusculus]